MTISFLQAKAARPHPQDTLMITVSDYQQQQQRQQRQHVPQKPPSTPVLEPPPQPAPPPPPPAGAQPVQQPAPASKRLTFTSDTLFDLLLLKLEKFYQKRLKIESKGTRYELGDFVVKVRFIFLTKK